MDAEARRTSFGTLGTAAVETASQHRQSPLPITQCTRITIHHTYWYSDFRICSEQNTCCSGKSLACSCRALPYHVLDPMLCGTAVYESI